MKKIVVILASVAFMASSASANPAAVKAAKDAAATVTKRNKTLGKRLSNLEGTVSKITSKAAGDAVAVMLGAIVTLEGSSDESIMEKDEAIAEIEAMATEAAELDDAFVAIKDVATGKVLDALKSEQDGDDALNASNIETYKKFTSEYKTLVASGIEAETAREQAAQSALGVSYEQFAEACAKPAAKKAKR